jgi:CBS domain-containing protein
VSGADQHFAGNLELDLSQGSFVRSVSICQSEVKAQAEMTTVRQLLDRKGKVAYTISPDATVFDAIAKMAERDVGSLLVTSGEQLVGIITERHYARNVVLKGKTSPNTPVRDIMERKVAFVRPEHTIDDCMALMSEMRVRHLPVLEGTRIVGIVSIGDLVKSVIGDQEFIIDQLAHYIHGH